MRSVGLDRFERLAAENRLLEEPGPVYRTAIEALLHDQRSRFVRVCLYNSELMNLDRRSIGQ